jgi:aspartokinase-like uncharacterized kinase
LKEKNLILNVIKIGGSLAQNPKALRTLCQKLSILAKEHSIVIVPGGGQFADCVRGTYKQFMLSETSTHYMAILGMDQYGWMLADLISNSQIAENLKSVNNAGAGLVVFLPSNLMRADEELPKSWEVTSDSIAVYIAEKLGTKNVLLLKDVEGIFTEDPRINPQAKLFEHLTIKELAEMENKTCTDAYLPKLLDTLKMDCHIINGLYPNRVETALNKQKTIGTIISP